MIDVTMHVFIASLAGHRSRYVQALLEHTPAELSPLEIVTFDDPVELPRGTVVHRQGGSPGPIRRARAILQTVRCAEDGRVLLLDGDASSVELFAILLAPLISRRLELVTLIMRPPTRSMLPTSGSALRATMKLLVLRFASRMRRVAIHPLDDITGAWAASVVDRRLAGLATAIDPIELRPGPVPHDLPAELPRPWFLCPGRLVARKNIPLLLAAWGQAEPPGTLILAGDSEPAIRSVLEDASRSHPANVCWLDRWLPEDQMDRLVVESDAVLLLHDNVAPSRNLGKALAAGTPVIGSRIPQIERLQPRFEVTTIDLTIDALSQALATHSDPQRPGPATRSASNTTREIDRGSPEEFAAVLLRLPSER